MQAGMELKCLARLSKVVLGIKKVFTLAITAELSVDG